MTTALFLFIYAAVLVFFIACLVRAYTYASAPAHLRWELYPVPHESRERLAHGGSYFESADWWTQPAHFNLWGEIKFMVPEMLFLKGLWEFNRKLWFRSFPFHFGLYLIIGTAALVLGAALLSLLDPGTAAGGAGRMLESAARAVGVAGGLLCLIGALGLLHKRLSDPALRNYTTPGDIFNLALFIVTLGFLFAAFLPAASDAPSAPELARGLLTFDTGMRVPALTAVALALAALLAAYIPLTHMSHFIAKYFTYHSVRWDDKATARDSRTARRIAEYLTYRPTWAAAHMTADGKRTWLDIATTNPAQGEKK